MKKRNQTMKERAARMIQKAAVLTVEHSVGRSYPLWMHEEKVPDEVFCWLEARKK